MAPAAIARSWTRARPYVCRNCVQLRRLTTRKQKWAGGDYEIKDEQWARQADKIRSGAEPSMLSILEARGLVKDVAGGRKPLDWLLTEKYVGAYVGVDPSAPSLHVGHLIPFMALYWMWLYGYPTIALVGGGTVKIGDPSGRKTARVAQARHPLDLNTAAIRWQLKQLWVNVKALGMKLGYPGDTVRRAGVLNNHDWLRQVSAVELLATVGSGMRLGTMLSRDSVKQRMTDGEGMPISEFCYPLFQGYDWWHMYHNNGVQLQIGGSDQYGNLCAGMDVVDHMRKLQEDKTDAMLDDTRMAPFGLSTPLLTTSSGEKFGKSAGNAVWLDKDMMSSFDLYQYFLRTADDDVERYLKLFTFIPLDALSLIMQNQRSNASERPAQHLLAKSIVELAHGAEAAKNAELAHRDAFARGTHVYSLLAVRQALERHSAKSTIEPAEVETVGVIDQKKLAEKKKIAEILAHKQTYLSTSASPASSASSGTDTATNTSATEIVTIPYTFFKSMVPAQFLHTAGLASTKSEGNRLIQAKGAYIVKPNSGSVESPYSLAWEPILNKGEFNAQSWLIDEHAIVLRAGKSKIRICHVVPDEVFKANNLTCPGWDAFQASLES